MPTYFHGWRRKLGVLTLVTACAFMAGWARSLLHSDVVAIFGKHTVASLQSNFGDVAFTLTWENDGKPRPTTNDGVLSVVELINPSKYLYWAERPIEVKHVMSDRGESMLSHSNWYWKQGRFIFAVDNSANESRDATLIAPYWSIVVPLTLLSAWLLLSKPRVATPKPASLR